MSTIDEGHLRFCFPENWVVVKYDDMLFYRNQFIKCHDNIKAVDIVALNPQNESLFLIEIKDYRTELRFPKHDELLDKICRKITMTLAGIFAASLNANVDNEKQFCQRFLKCDSIKVVLHIESRDSNNKLGFQANSFCQNMKEKLRQKIKAIDPHPKVVNQNGSSFEWTIENI